MFLLFAIYFLLIFPIFQCTDVDVSSIHVNPDLYRLCWKQSGSSKLDSLEGQCQGCQPEKFRIFENPRGSGTFYCVEKRDIQLKYTIFFPLFPTYGINLTVIFSMPLAPEMRIIRQRVVPSGVHFHLYRDFIGMPDGFVVTCNGILKYNLDGQIALRIFHMNSNNKSRIFENLNPGTSFNIYYSCFVLNWMKTSTVIMTDQGTVYPHEVVDPLQPFLQLPFSRFLVGHWETPEYVPNSYQIVIYEFYNGTDDKCLKIFRLYSLSEDIHIPTTSPKICDSTVPIEDMGIFQSCTNCSTYFVLDMVVPLKINKRYKLSILWMNQVNELKENFIYFEPLPNENIGKINPKIMNFRRGENNSVRNIISDMQQHVINRYPSIFPDNEWIDLRSFSELSILLSVSNNQSEINGPSKNLTYNNLNDKCQNEIEFCTDGPNPFYYLLTKTKSNGNDIVELIQIPKREISNNISISLTPDTSTYKFSISWSINSERKTHIPSLFAVQMISEKNQECFSLYIVTCSTCNRMHRQISEYNSRLKLSTWWSHCKTSVKLENHYGPMDSSITIHTKQMIPEENFRVEIYSINLNSSRYLGRSKPDYIRESFWSRYGNVFVGLICAAMFVALLVIVFLRCRRLAKEPIKVSGDVECNKYYTED